MSSGLSHSSMRGFPAGSRARFGSCLCLTRACSRRQVSASTSCAVYTIRFSRPSSRSRLRRPKSASSTTVLAPGGPGRCRGWQLWLSCRRRPCPSRSGSFASSTRRSRLVWPRLRAASGQSFPFSGSTRSRSGPSKAWGSAGSITISPSLMRACSASPARGRSSGPRATTSAMRSCSGRSCRATMRRGDCRQSGMGAPRRRPHTITSAN